MEIENKISNLLVFFEELKKVDNNLFNPFMFEKLKILDKKLKNFSFNVALVGEIKTGKSTIANSILRDNILGTDSLPETATLTIVKKSKNTKAKVTYYNLEEWNYIKSLLNVYKQDSDEYYSIKNIINIVENSNLKQKILDYGLTEEIDLENIKQYSSASSNEKISLIVKKIELEYPLPDWNDNIVLVDTPGLNDPIEIRNYITQEYIKEADIIILVLSAESLCKKSEIRFITNSIFNGNISKLIILINKIDVIVDKNYQELINFVKIKFNDIKENIEHILSNRIDLTKDEKEKKLQKISELLDNLSIFCISSNKILEKIKSSSTDEYLSLYYEFEKKLINILKEENLYNTIQKNITDEINLVISD